MEASDEAPYWVAAECRYECKLHPVLTGGDFLLLANKEEALWWTEDALKKGELK